MTTVQRITVDRTWDGAPVRAGEGATLALRLDGDALAIDVEAPFHGDPAPPGGPGATDGLWEFEVVELFILGPSARYTEIELGPHGHHLVLRLDGVRRPVESGVPIDFAATLDGPLWRGRAQVPLSALPPRPWRLNAYAIHGVGPARRYLAATPLPGPGPDFHRLDGFVIEATL